MNLTPLPGGRFSSLTLDGKDDTSTAAPRRLTAEICFHLESKTPNAPPVMPDAQLGRAIPATSETPAVIAPDSRTDALESSPANTWLAPRPPLQAPTELPPVRGVSTLREHPLASPIGLSYSIAYRSSRSASYAEPSLTLGDASSPAIPELLLNALPSEQIEEAAKPIAPPKLNEAFASAPAAAPAASFVQPAMLSALAAEAALFVPRCPRPLIAGCPPALERALPSLPAQSVEMEVQPLAAPIFAISAAALRLPQVEALGPSRAFASAAASEWMPGLESQPAAREVRPAEATTARAFARRPIQQMAFGLALAKTGQAETPENLAECVQSAPPMPVEAAPTAPAQSPAAISTVSLQFAPFRIEAVGGSPAEPAEFVAMPAAMPVEALPTAPARVPAAIAPRVAIALPQFGLAPQLEGAPHQSGRFERQTPSIALPKRAPNRHAGLEPVRSNEPATPPFQPPAPAPSIPGGQAMPMAFHSAGVSGVPRANPQWIHHKLDIAAPECSLRPVFERYESVVDLGKTDAKKSGVFDISEYPQFRKHQPVIQHASKAIAACLLVAVGLWFGAHAANLGRRVLARDAELAALESSSRAVSGVGRTEAVRSVRPLAWAKGAIAKRAAFQVSDSFQQGMQAWGAAAKSWAPGWSRNPDGYVRPGQLALLQPTLSYTDYRLEFFGQIEKKGMSWAVRARDPQNYYAMKFKVVEPGLRPVLAMVHYPVVDGRAGHSVEVPLSLMVHNDTAYHVAVQVRGRRFTASIEGQEVDSWTDDALNSGGVGFFSEAGERARLYWMKVYKNDDWLGRICAYLSGSSVDESQQTAWLERPEFPGPTPGRREPPPSEAVLVAGETGEFSSGRPQRSAQRAASPGRIRTWSL